jgi:hypothetical protein
VEISYNGDDAVISITGETDPLNILVNGECELKHTNNVGCNISVYESKKVTVKGAAGAKLTVKSDNAGIVLYDTELVFEGIETVIDGSEIGIAGEAPGEGNKATVTVRGSKMQIKGASDASISSIAALNLQYCEISSPTGAEFDKAKFGVVVSGTLTKDNIEIKPDPELRPAMVEEGSGSFTLKHGDDEFTDLGWFNLGDNITITAKPAKGYVFVRWTDDTNWQDPDNRKGEERTIDNWDGKALTFKALFCYKTQSAAEWHGVNDGNFITFPMGSHGQKVTEATSPSAANLNAGDWVNNKWYYFENKKDLKSMPYTEIDDEGKATPKEEDIKTLYASNSTINVTDATYNFKEGMFYYVAGKNLYSIDIVSDTPEPEFLGVFHVKTDEVSVVAIAADAAGTFYVLSDANEALYTFTTSDIDTKKSWVTLTPVGGETKGGKLDIDVQAGEQSIAFDHVTGELFWGRADYLRLIDTKELKTHIVGDFGQKVIKSLHRKDRRITVAVKVAEGQSEMGTVKVNGKSEETRVFAGSTVTLEAVAKEGYQFQKWTFGDEGSSTEATLKQKVSAARTYTAHFVKATGLDEINADEKDEVRKVMVDGAIYIIRDGRIYGIDGRLVK